MNNVDSPKPSVMSTLRVQGQVIYALIMREIITRFGRKNLGFLWFALEPIILAAGVVAIRIVMHTNFRSAPIAPFIVISYCNLMVWRLCASRGMVAIESNRSLLYYRQIRIQDIFTARMLLEVAGVTTSFLFLWLLFAFMGLMTWPKDPLLMATGWLLACWFAASLGTFLGCLSHFFEVVDRIWPPISHFLMIFSAVFYEVDWLPKILQRWILINPFVHPIEMTRAGYWGDGPHWHYSMMYLTGACMTLTLASGLLMRNQALRSPRS